MATQLNSTNLISNVIMALTITHWRIPHFWLVHRFMHPWRTEYFPDVGKFLYRHVHAIHHKSYNTTAFSGTNMHPVESTVYYSAALLVLPLGALFGPLHPCIALGYLVDLAMGAWIGHDGFEFPGGGDFYHSLHHQYFDCNYGTSQVPIDYMLGLFAASKEDVGKIWRKKPSGRDANDTFVQPDSSSFDKVK
jgi:sterol desaturase/sphingolipid hydroxylase (fatty acid hydroxylase superfamily)